MNPLQKPFARQDRELERFVRLQSYYDKYLGPFTNSL